MPGPAPQITRQLLLDAGLEALQSESLQVTASDVLGLQLADVLRIAGEKLGRGRPIGAPGLYKHWENFDHYVHALIPHIFNPNDLDTTAPKSLVEHARQDLSHAHGQEARAWISLIGAARDPLVAEAIQVVYAQYDDTMGPSLRARLISEGVEIDEEDLSRLMTTLTALTEGFMLRSQVEGSPRFNDIEWAVTTLLEGLRSERHATRQHLDHVER